MGLRDDHTVRRVYMAAPGETFDGEGKARIAVSYPSWFLFHPYEEPGTGYIEWLRVPSAVFERWVGPLVVKDFRANDGSSLDCWPESWRVLLG